LVKESYLNGIPLPVIIEELLIPVLKEIGFLWEKGKITPAQEHYFSSIIEELIAFLGKSISIQEKKNFSVLLMVTGSEEHVITLKMASEYFRLKNWQVYYVVKIL
jgi:methanogenic corrinoid protein MtbC1